MASQTTQLIVELLDKVSAPARAVGRSLAGISLAGFDFLWSGAGALAAAALLMRKG